MYLELDRLSKQFDGKYAVHDLSLGLEEGGLLCILGSSGCGKTTTLNMIGGFLKPDGGRVLLDGQDITALPPERRPVSTVFQSYGLFPHMSVLQNVTYGLKFRGYSRAEAKEKGRRYLTLVGLAERENARIGELSGGQQQRVALARALIVEPKLCLLDEPLSNLDAALRVRMRGELKRLQRELGTTMVFVTHDQEEALILADSIAVMSEGELLQLGSAEEVFRHPANDYIASFLGLNDIVWKDDGSVPDMLSRLQQGTCDAIVINVENAQGYLASNPNFRLVTFDEGSGFTLPAKGSCVGLRKSDNELLDQINTILSGIDDDARAAMWQAAVDGQPQ